MHHIIINKETHNNYEMKIVELKQFVVCMPCEVHAGDQRVLVFGVRVVTRAGEKKMYVMYDNISSKFQEITPQV